MSSDETTRAPHPGATREMVVIRVHRHKTTRMRCVGLLRPFDMARLKELRIDRDELLIGRDPLIGAVIPDTTISRRHARIIRDGDEFLIEDLDSSNGTFVANIPIVTCPLSDGDRVEFGRCAYYFERRYEIVDLAGASK